MSKSARKKSAPNTAARPAAAPTNARTRTPASHTPYVIKHRRTWAYWAVGGLVVAGLLFVSFLSDSNRPGSSSTNAILPVGSRAPQFAGSDPLTGQLISSTYLAGKNVLYYFSAGSTCQACMTQAQALQQDASQLARDHITLVMVTNDNAQTLAASARSYGLTIPMVADPGGVITNRFGAVGGGMDMGPNTADHSFVLVDRHGIVRFHEDFPSMWISTSALLHRFPMMA
ncbi:MAG TPA: redoxin domain-containing protein [Acidimicrobiales bacterium]|nr:redoxin domain-containing protein [Acidimicrobiales bacterium]